MPFDPTKPASGSPITSAEMRAQLTALNVDIQQRTTPADIANAIAVAVSGTSNNSNAVSTLGQTADAGYNQSQMQAVLDKPDEIIHALRR